MAITVFAFGESNWVDHRGFDKDTIDNVSHYFSRFPTTELINSLGKILDDSKSESLGDENTKNALLLAIAYVPRLKSYEEALSIFGDDFAIGFTVFRDKNVNGTKSYITRVLGTTKTENYIRTGFVNELFGNMGLSFN